MSDTEARKRGMFRDNDGNVSSKRIVGTLLVVTGAAYLMIVGFISIGSVVADPTTALDAGRTLVLTGGGIITGGVIEKFGGRK
jgi:hypothetical protein